MSTSHTSLTPAPQGNAHNHVTLAGLLIALGIIYGDIGTSPLYVLKALTGQRVIEPELILGGVSCIFWTLVLQTTIKYVWLTLKADNQGEGGIISLYSLVRKYGRRLVIPTMIGAAALLADGMITPAISVTSAVEGLSTTGYFGHVPVTPIVLLIVSGIFLFQRFGTQQVGRAFGPVMMIWFLMLLLTGLLWTIRYPNVLEALNPVYGYRLLTHYPQGFWLLGAVFLCTTGAEALYSDLGHCGRKNIRITWIFVKICLMAQYLGQAAWLLSQEGATLQGGNPFFLMMPQWFRLTGILIATAAAVIASQALISGSFTLINEAMNINFWIRMGVRQPSELKGQIYIPGINLLLWAGCCFIILYFGSSDNMEAAYGLAITFAMLMTTCLLYFFLRYRLKWSRAIVYPLLSVFLIIELAFFTANLLKIKEGGYVTLILGGIFFLVMYITYTSRKINNRYTRFVRLGKYAAKIRQLSEDEEIPRFASQLIYLTKADRKEDIEEWIMDSIFSVRPKRADRYWFVHINRVNNPYTLDYEVSAQDDGKLIRITINMGFRIQPRTELFFKTIVDDLIRTDAGRYRLEPDPARKYNEDADFKFVVIEKFLSFENELTFREGIMLKSYFLLKKLGQRDEQAFGLDKSDVVVEQVPLVYQPVKLPEIRRRDSPPGA